MYGIIWQSIRQGQPRGAAESLRGAPEKRQSPAHARSKEKKFFFFFLVWPARRAPLFIGGPRALRLRAFFSKIFKKISPAALRNPWTLAFFVRVPEGPWCAPGLPSNTRHIAYIGYNMPAAIGRDDIPVLYSNIW